MSTVFASSDYVYQEKTDWKQVLDDIRAAGFSFQQISDLIGAPHSTVSAWSAGHEPRHSYGEALLVLHARYCRSNVPCGTR